MSSQWRLDDEAAVDLRLLHGTLVTAVVAGRPSMQVFRDAVGREDTNAYVRIEDPAQPERRR